MSTRTISIRLEDVLVSRIDEKCATDRCCRNDFVKKAISDSLESSKEPAPQARVTAVSYDDGKTWVDLE